MPLKNLSLIDSEIYFINIYLQKPQYKFIHLIFHI